MNLDSLVGALKSAEEEQQQEQQQQQQYQNPQVARLAGSSAHLRRNTADQFADVLSTIRLDSLDSDDGQGGEDQQMGHDRTDSFDAGSIANALSGLDFGTNEESFPEPDQSYSQPPQVQLDSYGRVPPPPPPPPARKAAPQVQNNNGNANLGLQQLQSLNSALELEPLQPQPQQVPKRSWSLKKKEKYEPKTATAKLMTSTAEEDKSLEQQSKAEQKLAKKRAAEHAKEEKRKAKEKLKQIKEEKAKAKREESLKAKQEEQKKRVEEARKKMEEEERVKKARIQQIQDEGGIQIQTQDTSMPPQAQQEEPMSTQSMGRSGSYLEVDDQQFPRARSSSFGKTLPKPPGRRNESQYNFAFMSETDDQFEARNTKSLQNEFHEMEAEFERLSQSGDNDGAALVRSRLIQLEARIDYLLEVQNGGQNNIPEVSNDFFSQLPPIPADPEAVLADWENDFTIAKNQDRFEDCILIRNAIDELKAAMESHEAFHQYMSEQMAEMRAALDDAKNRDDFETAMEVKQAMEALERDAEAALAAAIEGGAVGGGEAEGGADFDFQSQFNQDMVYGMREQYEDAMQRDAMEEAMGIQSEMREMGEAIYAEQQMVLGWIEEAKAEGAMQVVPQMGQVVDMLQTFIEAIP